MLGRNGAYRKLIQKSLPVRIVDRGNNVVVMGNPEEAARVTAMLEELLIAIRKGHAPTREDVIYALDDTKKPGSKDLGAVLGDTLPCDRHGKGRGHS